VSLSETLEASMRLPVTFMLLPPQSWHPDVWTDITRMLTLNSVQHAKGREMHLCPMQFDLIDRAVRQFTMPGETVFDPFLGIGEQRSPGIRSATGTPSDSSRNSRSRLRRTNKKRS